jgi:hypothetical protein
MAIECRHCDGTGTCSNGEDGNSCASCAEKASEGPFPFKKKKIDSMKGLPCGICQGYGDVEGRVWHLQSTISPVIGVLVVAIVLMIILAIAATSPTHHTEILTLLGTLAGSVIGFYFRGHHTVPKAPQTRSPRLPEGARSRALPSERRGPGLVAPAQANSKQRQKDGGSVEHEDSPK